MLQETADNITRALEEFMRCWILDFVARLVIYSLLRIP
jgi:hypothetical protein